MILKSNYRIKKSSIRKKLNSWRFNTFFSWHQKATKNRAYKFWHETRIATPLHFVILLVYLLGLLSGLFAFYPEETYGAGWQAENVRLLPLSANRSVSAMEGNKIVFDEADSVYLYDFDKLNDNDPATEPLEQLTTPADNQASYCISGNKIVMYNDALFDVFLFDLELHFDGNPATDPLIRITSAPSSQYSPCISGDYIAWEDRRNWGAPLFEGTDVYLYNLTSGVETRLTAAGDQVAPKVSGDYVVWANLEASTQGIYYYNIATGTTTRITNSATNQSYPAIKGNIIAWGDNRSGNYDIYTYNLVTGQETQITTSVNDEFYPEISENKIVFHQNSNGAYDVFLYDLTRSEQVQVTTDPNDQGRPFISGSRVAWRDNRVLPFYDLYYASVIYQEDPPPNPPNPPTPPQPPVSPDPTSQNSDAPVSPVIQAPVQESNNREEPEIVPSAQEPELSAPKEVLPAPTRWSKLKNAFGKLLKDPGKSIMLIRGAATEIIKETPPPVAYSFPYLLFIILGLFAWRLLLEARAEATQASKLLEILNMEKLIAEEKENFIALSSHYFRTPVTLLKLGVSMVEGGAVAIKDGVTKTINALDLLVQKLLDAVENNQYLSQIVKPDVKKEKVKIYTSPFLWLPLILVAGVAIFANYLFERVAQIDIHIINYISEGLAFLLVIQLFVYSFRKKRNNRENYENLKKAEEYEISIDAARNRFIMEAASGLEIELKRLSDSLPSIDGEAKPVLVDGTTRFNEILKKLMIIKELKAGKVVQKKEYLPLKQSIETMLKEEEKSILEKKLNVEVRGEETQVFANRELLSFVLKSVISNAVKFTKEAGQVTITLSQSPSSTTIKVEDNGIGISKEGMMRLFKPFSRATSALTFDYEGSGLSLFLSKIIAEYMGGDIQVESEQDKGTRVTFLVKT